MNQEIINVTLFALDGDNDILRASFFAAEQFAYWRLCALRAVGTQLS